MTFFAINWIMTEYLDVKFHQLRETLPNHEPDMLHVTIGISVSNVIRVLESKDAPDYQLLEQGIKSPSILSYIVSTVVTWVRRDKTVSNWKSFVCTDLKDGVATFEFRDSNEKPLQITIWERSEICSEVKVNIRDLFATAEVRMNKEPVFS